MELTEKLEFCKICKKRKMNLKIGLVCSLTDKKPDFQDSCSDFIKDEKEASRQLKLKLKAAGNSRTQNGSLSPGKNRTYGIFILMAGIIVFLFSILIGVIIIITGVSFIIKANQQDKVLQKNKELDDKISR